MLTVEVIIEEAVWWPDMGVELPTQRICLTLPPDCHEAQLAIAAVLEREIRVKQVEQNYRSGALRVIDAPVPRAGGGAAIWSRRACR